MSNTQNGTTRQLHADLEADIARQREQLADTVDALHAKLDVKSRLTTDNGRPRPQVVAAVVAVAAAVAGVVVLRRRHH